MSLVAESQKTPLINFKKTINILAVSVNFCVVVRELASLGEYFLIKLDIYVIHVIIIKNNK